MDEPQVPSMATREKWASHFGVAKEEARPPSRLGPFSGPKVPIPVSMELVLKAFVFLSRAVAEELGKRAVQARAEAQQRRARAAPIAEDGELG